MATQDKIISSVLSKTLTGKLKWDGFSAVVNDNHLSLYHDEFDRPCLSIDSGNQRIDLQDEAVNELYAEVEARSLADESGLLDDLDEL